MTDKYFSSTLKEYIKEHRVNREHIIETFNKSHFSSLEKCDVTTLSRWISGKTEPNLYKQFSVCIALGIDLLEYIKGVDPLNFKESRKDKEAIDNHERYLNSSNSVISYFSRREHVDVYYSLLESEQHRNVLEPFFNNFSGYLSLRKRVDENNLVKPFNVYLFKEEEVLCGHLAFSDDNAQYLKIFGVYKDSLENSIGILPAYYIDAKVYWLVISSLLYFYLSRRNYTKNLYATISVRERSIWEFYRQVADGETLTFFSPATNENPQDKGFYYIQFNILKLLSRPSILLKLKKYMVNYPQDSILPIDIQS